MQALPSSSTSEQVLRTTMPVVTGCPLMKDVRMGRAAMSRRGAGTGAELVHDAGHLLGALRRYSELMTTPGVLSEEYGHLAQELQVLSDRSAAMLGRLMLLLGVETAPERLAAAEAEVTVLPEAVLECLELLSKIAGRGVTFFCSPSAYLPVAVGRSAVQRILVNLVKNAAEAGPAGETVAVTLTGMREPGRETAELVLTVQGRGRSGTGTGALGRAKGAAMARVPDADVRRGIGFQVVRELAESSGAKVEMESEPGAGASVSVRWPAMDPGRGRRGAAAGWPEAVGEEMLVGGGAC